MPGRYLIFLVLAPLWGYSQILDDTTKVTFGTQSTRFMNENDLRFNNPSFQYLDTTIFSTYKISKPEQSNYYLENLGVEGTSNRYLYYELPDEIGVDPGFHSFATFFKKPEDFRYYNTRAPYSRLSLYLGGGNRSITDVELSRSDSVLFNVGFTFKKWSIDRQQAKQERGDKISESTQYDLYTHIRSKNLKYQLMANISRTRHIFTANGGVDTTEVEGNYYDRDVGINLKNARADELRVNMHLFHQYSIRDHLEIYNSIDKYRQRNEFVSDPLGDDALFFQNFFIDPSATRDSTDFDYFRYEFGVKGSNNRWFYNVYMKNRHYDFHYKYHDADTLGADSLINNQSGIERSVGFHASYALPFGYLLSGGMEYMNADDVGLYNDNNESYISIAGPHLDLTYRHAEYKPTFVQQQYLGNHSFWVNNFRNTFAQTVRARFYVNLGPATISPTFRYDKVRDYIYFARDKFPVQAEQLLHITSPGLQFRIDFLRHFTFEAGAVHSIVDSDTVTMKQVPEWMINSRIYYNNIFFQRNLEINTGFDVHYKSPYYGDDFAPDVQQFFVQTHTIVGDFPVVTFFLDFKINRANFIVRFNNLWPNFSKSKGYLVAPLYPGLPQLFDFGFNWRFFD